MVCLYYFFMWPFYLMYYIVIASIYVIYYGFEILMYIVRRIIDLFAIIFGKNITRINYKKSNKNYSKNVNKKRNKDISWKEAKFEEEADLWGLSKEDRRIAKEERMSPSDFVEAEERDDDELFTDEWED